MQQILSRSANQNNSGKDFCRHTITVKLKKPVNTWNISGMLIVWWPITIMFRTHKQTSKPQTNYCCCLRFSFLMPYWLFSHNTITFYEYFWCSRFCKFHCKTWKGWPNLFKFQSMSIPAICSNWQRETVSVVEYSLKWQNWTVFWNSIDVKKRLSFLKDSKYDGCCEN